MKLFKNQKGFTLIELLVVVAILGILAAVAIPNVIRYIDSSKLTAANIELETVKTSVMAYAADNYGTYPTDTSQIEEFITNDLKGTYTITNGIVTGVTYADTNFEWSTELEQWVR